ncbi:MAG: T9SS type A sorting domain-containing protein [Chitinophagales bacterium]|nr:T9SS type A sorting domain-containing protein [Chitinophagales bacterium]
MKAQIFICAFLLISLIGKAQITFDTTYDHNLNQEFGISILLLPDSAYLCTVNSFNFATGNNQDLLLYKIKPTRNISFLTILGEDSSYFYGGLPGSLIKLHDENYASCGTKVYYNNNSDGIYIKYDRIGNIVFYQLYHGGYQDALYNITETYDHGIVMIGYTTYYDSIQNKTTDDCLLMKVDSNGKVLWRKTFGGLEVDAGYSVHEISEKRLFISCLKKFAINNLVSWIIITDSIGNIIQEKEFNNSSLNCDAAFTTTSLDNQYFLWGCIDTIINSNDYSSPAFIGKLDENLNFVWKTIFNGPTLNGILNVRQLSDSSIVFVGGSYPYAWIGKLTKSGKMIWQKNFQHDTSPDNYFADFQQTWDKGYIITGSTNGPTGQDLWLVKLDSNGVLATDTFNTGTVMIDTKKPSFKAYPNPATDQLYIEFNDGKNETWHLIITDSYGRRVFKKNYTGNYVVEVPLNTLSNGIYFVQGILNGKSINAQPVIIQKTIDP